MVKLLHFADAHIDIANYGRYDAQSGLPLRVMDFLKSLDTIIDTAISERVDLVLFAGDAYKDRNPSPTFQREWGKRLMRLSRAGIPTLMLVGNHDLSPALGRAHALDTFATLEVPHVRVVDHPIFLGPDDLEGVPVQILALPWIARSGLIATLGLQNGGHSQIYQELEQRLTDLIHGWLEEINPSLPVILTAHCTVQGAQYGPERSVMLGDDLVLSGSIVRDPRLDYVALGHIHKAQDLNKGSHPPVIYPGSIERVDFGEAADEKFFVIVHIRRGETQVEWCQLDGIRPFLDCSVELDSAELDSSLIMDRLRAAMPPREKLSGAILRLVLKYPKDLEALIDEAALREYAASCFEFRLSRQPQMDARIRLPDDRLVGNFSAVELLDVYWRANHIESAEIAGLTRLAKEVISSPSGEE